MVAKAEGAGLVSLLENTFKSSGSGVILMNLIANKETAPKVTSFVSERFEWAVENMQAFSDPNFKALAMLAARDKKLRPRITAHVAGNLGSNPATLTVLYTVLPDETLNIHDLVVPVLQYCDRRQPDEWWSLACLLLRKLLPEGEPELKAYVEALLAEETADSLIRAFGALKAAVDAHPASGSKIVLDASIAKIPLSQLVCDDEEVMLACLEMVSSACVLPENRKPIAETYGSVVDKARHSKITVVHLLGSVVYTKLVIGGVTGHSAQDALVLLVNISKIFEDFIRNENSESYLRYLPAALEGLACTSVLTAVKLRVDSNLITHIVASVKRDDAASAYAALCILANLTEYPMKKTKHQQQLRQLRSGLQFTIFDIQPRITPEEVEKPVDFILESQLVQWLSQGCSKLSPNSREKCIILLRNMACQQKQQRRIQLAVQGGVVIAMYLWTRDKDPEKLTPENRAIAGSVIAKILTSVPPPVAFTERFPALLVVEPLRTQLNNSESERRNLDTFEALMALTNLASTDDEKLRTQIALKCWSKIEEALDTEFIQIQRAVIELICNIMFVSAGAARFLDHSERGSGLRSVLGKCLEMPDRDGKLAAAGAIAVLSDWTGAAEVLCHNDDITRGLINSLDDPKDHDILLRVLTALVPMVRYGLQHEEEEILDEFVAWGLLSKLEALADLINSEWREVSSYIYRILRMLARFKLDKSDI